jgi:transposase-like protein
VLNYGKQANGIQRYWCNDQDCTRRIFLLQCHDPGRLPAIKQRIVDLTLNSGSVHEIVRVLGVSSATVVSTPKKGHRPPTGQ